MTSTPIACPSEPQTEFPVWARPVLVRGDDAGSTRQANHGLREAAEAGLLRNISVMAVGPAFDHAAEELQDLGDTVCFGLHATIHAEWESLRWGPILPASAVPSLVEEDGTFVRTSNVLAERGFSLEEIAAEITAQLEKARAAQWNVSYLDEHMNFGWLPGVRPVLRDLAAREGLIYLPDLPLITRGEVDGFGGGHDPHLLITHPCSGADPSGAGLPAEIFRARQEELQWLTQQEITSLFAEHHLWPIKYTELAGTLLS